MRTSTIALFAAALALPAGSLACGNHGSPSVSLPAFQDLTSAPAPIQQAAAAVVRIRTASELATGSFISATGLLLTNNHVLGTEICPIEGCYAQITFDYQRGKKSAGPQNVFVVPTAVSVGLDMAVVQVYAEAGGSPLSSPSFLAIEPADAASLMTTHVTLVGHPRGHLKKWTAGEVFDSNGDWITTSAYLLPGDSGSPILNDAGKLVGIIHRGPTGEGYFTSNGALTYSIGTPSASLQAAMSAPLPPEMVSVLAMTTQSAAVTNDVVYRNAHAATMALPSGPLSVLSALGSACDAALAVQDYPTPEDLSSALQPCADAMTWIECRADETEPSSGTVCPAPADVALWQQRFSQMNAAYLALNGQTWLDPVSFGVASLSPDSASGLSAGAASLQQALSAASQPLDLGVADYLAAFAVPSYRGVTLASYVSDYPTIPGYALDAGDAASAAVWLVNNGILGRNQGLGIVERIYGDPSLDVEDRLYVEDIEYQAGLLE